MIVIVWGGGRGRTRVVTCARGPSRPRKSRGLLVRASVSRALVGGDVDPCRAGKSRATRSLRRGYGKTTLFDPWMRATRRGACGPREARGAGGR
jgi:hypothetical protein